MMPDDQNTKKWKEWLRNFDHRQVQLNAASRIRRKALADICVERGRPDLAKWLRLVDWDGEDAQ